MDYKNKYEQALERARIWKDKSGMPKDKQGILDDIFPELKESEDERIINLLKMVVEKWRNVGYADYVMDIPKSDIFTWLEKQGEHANFRNKIQIGDKVTRNKDGMLVNLSQLNRVAKQGEPDIKEPNSEDERIRKELIEHCRNTRCVTEEGAERIAKWITWLKKQMQKPQGKSALEAAKEEKVDSQNCVKHTDKIEPMFHEGEWIVHHGTENIYQVVNVIDNQYQLKYGDTYTVQKCTDVDKCARLWDIAKDAKDGDVLFIGIDASTCIFKKLEGNLLYSYIISDGKLLVEDSHYYYEISDNVYPATKEQRDTLFAKMKEAGYEWNSDKKELKKIEQKPNYCHHEVDLSGCSEEYCKAYYDGWNNCNQQHAQLEAEQKPAWSEENERHIDTITSLLKDRKKEQSDWGVEVLDEEITWLKILKERYTWKPSDEQMEALKEACDEHWEPDGLDPLYTLWEQLKKLREE